MKRNHIQYTVRAVHEDVDAALSEPLRSFHDLDFLSGTWVKDEACEATLAAFDRIDENMWK